MWRARTASTSPGGAMRCSTLVPTMPSAMAFLKLAIVKPYCVSTCVKVTRWGLRCACCSICVFTTSYRRCTSCAVAVMPCCRA